MPIEHWQPVPNEDLSQVVKRFSAVRKSTRKRLANDEKTRELLAAAIRLIDRQFAASDANTDEEMRRYPFFQWLSRHKIATEVAAATPGLAEEDRFDTAASTVKLLERRWTPHDRFIQDLLHYALSKRHWSLHLSLSGDALKLLLHGLHTGDFAAGVHEVAYEDLLIPVETPGFQRMQLLAAVLAEREPELQQVLMDMYQAVDKSWTALYEALFEERGWKLRPGLSFQDLNLMLSTAAEGMALRSLVDPTGIIDKEARTSLLGTLSLALTISCVDPGDGYSLEELVRALTAPDAERTDGPTVSSGGPP